jgi:Zn-dependent M28 family amino/carboxypeptidase
LLILFVVAACTSEHSTGDVGVAPGSAATAFASNPVERAAQQIDQTFVRELVIELSDDKYGGRAPASKGDLAARKYLADQLSTLGLEPSGAAGGWEQVFDIVSIDTQPSDDWSFTAQGRSASFRSYDQFLINADSQQQRIDVAAAEVVFAGYGIQAPEYDWDDYKNVDVTGKVVVLMNNDPDWAPDLFAGETRLWYGRWDYKFLTAAKNGAVGAIIIHTPESAGYPFQVLQASYSGVQFELPVGAEPRSQFKAWMTEDAVAELVALADMELVRLQERAASRDFEPIPLGVTTSISANVVIDRVQTANVLGLIPGSDPELKDEVVVYTAHHDHIGIGPADESGDTIYNGARDNALGVAQVIAIAKAFRALPEAPRRSILFCLVGAEEQGLLGSKWYAAHPTFPPGKIAANLNYDSGNIWGDTHDVTYIGYGKSSIDQVVSTFAAEQGRVIKPDQFPDRGYFYRSDQFSFARIGVPALYLEEGTDFVDRPPDWGKDQINQYNAVHYHQPSDEYDPSWNLDGFIKDTLLGFRTGLEIANAENMPVWNAGDEFEAARLRAIADAAE